MFERFTDDHSVAGIHTAGQNKCLLSQAANQ